MRKGEPKGQEDTRPCGFAAFRYISTSSTSCCRFRVNFVVKITSRKVLGRVYCIGTLGNEFLTASFYEDPMAMKFQLDQ